MSWAGDTFRIPSPAVRSGPKFQFEANEHLWQGKYQAQIGLVGSVSGVFGQCKSSSLRTLRTRVGFRLCLIVSCECHFRQPVPCTPKKSINKNWENEVMKIMVDGHFVSNMSAKETPSPSRILLCMLGGKEIVPFGAKHFCTACQPTWSSSPGLTSAVDTPSSPSGSAATICAARRTPSPKYPSNISIPPIWYHQVMSSYNVDQINNANRC